MMILKLVLVKELVLGLIARRWQSQDVNTVQSPPESLPRTTAHNWLRRGEETEGTAGKPGHLVSWGTWFLYHKG